MKNILIVILLLLPITAMAETLPKMTVWKSPSCGCCGNWINHMKAAGFQVEIKNVEEMQSVKTQSRIPENLRSCHTAKVGGYLIEGHVPAADVKRLLAEKHITRGLAVPGMPSGSPGMENGEHDPYNVVTFDKNGVTSIFSKHR